MNARGVHWWSVNIGSGNGSVSSGNRSLTVPILAKCHDAKWCYQWLNSARVVELFCWSSSLPFKIIQNMLQGKGIDKNHEANMISIVIITLHLLFNQGEEICILSMQSSYACLIKQEWNRSNSFKPPHNAKKHRNRFSSTDCEEYTRLAGYAHYPMTLVGIFLCCLFMAHARTGIPSEASRQNTCICS